MIFGEKIFDSKFKNIKAIVRRLAKYWPTGNGYEMTG